jgi:hypothetical protein
MDRVFGNPLGCLNLFSDSAPSVNSLQVDEPTLHSRKKKKQSLTKMVCIGCSGNGAMLRFDTNLRDNLQKKDIEIHVQLYGWSSGAFPVANVVFVTANTSISTSTSISVGITSGIVITTNNTRPGTTDSALSDQCGRTASDTSDL